MVLSRVKILESSNGWLILWSRSRVTRAQTAAEALRRVQRKGKRIAKDGASNAVIIEWTTKTELGRIIVRALQE